MYAVENNATFIVHTNREKRRIYELMPDAEVFVHPIVWPENYGQSGKSLRRLAVKDFFGDKITPYDWTIWVWPLTIKTFIKWLE